MLKGQAEIILTNADGTEQRFVEDNMFTSALQNIIDGANMLLLMQPNTSMSKILRAITPAYKHLLGGILLFEDPIPEDADMILPPVGNKNTGYADDGAHALANNNLLGSYNAYESGATEDGKGWKSVWEWNTAQANGKTSCICLTSRLGGACGWRSDTVPSYNTFLCGLLGLGKSNTDQYMWENYDTVGIINGLAMGICYEVTETDDEYVLGYFGEDGTYAYIVKVSYPKKVKLTTAYGAGTVEILHKIDISNNRYNSSNWKWGLNPITKVVSHFYRKSNVNYCTAIDLSTGDMTSYNLGNILGASNSMDYGSTIIINGFAYIPEAYGTCIHRVNLTDSTIVDIAIPAKSEYLLMMSDGKLIARNNSYKDHAYMIDTATDEYVGTVSTTSVTNYGYQLSAPVGLKLPYIISSLSWSSGSSKSTSFAPTIITPYLATINNLTTPIIKDNTQTLKVIYTIREG